MKRLLTALVGFLVGGVLIKFGFDGRSLDNQFATDSVHVAGVVDNLVITGGRYGTSYRVGYYYRVGDIEERVARKRVQKVTWSQLQIGKSIPIKYLAHNPAVSRVDDSKEDQFQENQHWAELIIGGIAICIAFLKLTARRASSSEKE